VALSIGINEGSKIRVGNKLLVVQQIPDARHVHILYGREPFLITDEERTEVEPGVYIQCGVKADRPFQENFSRLAFEAPRAVGIHRIRD
jgi:hypothetical protein